MDDEDCSFPSSLYQESFFPLIDAYNGFLIDLWGVTHDGVAPFPGVLECLDYMQKKGKRVIFFSNSSRRSAIVAQHLAQMKITLTPSRTLLTAGEHTFQALTNHVAPYEDFGFPYYPLGPILLDSPPFEPVSSLEKATFVLNTGPDHPRETISDYVPLLKSAFMHKLPMVCANPDRVAFDGDVKHLCAGALASFYEGLGGIVHYHGKPMPSFYQEAFTALNPMDRDKILAVGDSFETDVQGACRVGIDVAFVPGGIHREELGIHPGHLPADALFQTLSSNWAFRPTYVVPGLFF